MDLLVSYTFIGREELLQKFSSVSQFRKTAALRHRLWSHRKLSHLGNMLYILLCCMRSEPQQTRDNRALQTQEQAYQHQFCFYLYKNISPLCMYAPMDLHVYRWRPDVGLWWCSSQAIHLNFLPFLYYYCVCDGREGMCPCAHLKVWGQFCGVGSLTSFYGFWVSNSGLLACTLNTLSSESSQPALTFFEAVSQW